MTKEELEKEANKQSYLYDTKYSEDYTLEDRLNRPKDFVKGAIKDLIDLLKRKAYRDGYLAGADPREKRIAELEKENAELKNSDSLCKIIGKLKVENSRLSLIILGNEEEIAGLKKDCDEYSKTFNRQNVEIINLRKERIEMKKEISELKEMLSESDISIQKTKDYDGCVTSIMNASYEIKELKCQLDEAKEIIKKLVEGIRIISDPKVELTDVDSFVAEAEQFLGEE